MAGPDCTSTSSTEWLRSVARLTISLARISIIGRHLGAVDAAALFTLVCRLEVNPFDGADIGRLPPDATGHYESTAASRGGPKST